MSKKSNSDKKIISVGIIKNKTGGVLIVHRLREENTYDGKKLTWVFPGGKMNDGETPEEAVIREVSQETGFNVKVVKKISEREHPQLPVELKYFYCEMVPGRIKAISDIHEIDNTKWVNPNELMNFITTDLDPAVAKFLGL